MRILSFLLILVLLSTCTPTRRTMYQAPRHTERHYRQRQHLHQRERDRQLYQRLNYDPLSWLLPA